MSKFQDVETFAFFVGYPRSGHSLVGACLDAHPNAVISHELDALALLKEGYGRIRLFEAICEKARSFYESGSEWSGYSYLIPNMWQGRYETIKLIGDKRGGTSAKHLEDHPELLNEVKKLAPNCRIIHVVRNPFDCIASAVVKRELRQQRKFNSDDVLRKAGHFFQKAKTIERIIVQENENVLSLRHEDLLKEPRKVLAELGLFLGLPVFEEYLQACCTKIWPSPNQSRDRVDFWDESTTSFIQNQINQFSFFKGYTFYSK